MDIYIDIMPPVISKRRYHHQRLCTRNAYTRAWAGHGGVAGAGCDHHMLIMLTRICFCPQGTAASLALAVTMIRGVCTQGTAASLALAVAMICGVCF